MPEPALLEPDWAQPKPTYSEVQLMCRRIGLTHVNLPEQPFGEFLRQLRQSHDHGGAHLAAFEVSPDNIFDWFAARNRLSDEDLIDSLVVHPAIRGTLPDLAIPELKVKSGLTFADPFILDSRFAHCLHAGGAYWKPKENGKDAKTLALGVCEAMFGLRYGEIALIEVPKLGRLGFTASPGI